MEPADTVAAEDLVPIEIAGPELAGGRVTAVRDADRAADAEAALGEIQPVAGHTANAVKGLPEDIVCGDTALKNEVFEQSPDVIVRKGGAHGGFETETAAETPGNIIFAT